MKRPTACLEEDDAAEESAIVVAEPAEAPPPMGHLAAQGLMDKLKGMAKSGRTYPLESYKKCRTWADKRTWMARFSVDKQCSWLQIEESQSLQRSSRDRTAIGWCFLWDVARLNGIPWSEEPTRIEFLKTLVHGCKEKDPEQQHLLDAGWSLYYYTKVFETAKTSDRSSQIQLTATAKVNDEEEFTSCVQMIDNEAGNSGSDMQAPRGSGKAAGAPRGSGERPCADAKTLFKVWGQSMQRKLANILNTVKSQQIKVQDCTRKPWYSKTLVKELERMEAKIVKLNERLLRELALGSNLGVDALKAKKYVQLKETFESFLAEVNDNDGIVKTVSGLLSKLA